jgi:hypothetical protein
VEAGTNGWGKKRGNGIQGKSRRGVEGASDVCETAAFESDAARAVVLGFETDAATAAATAIATDVSGSEMGETKSDESGALVGAARDAGECDSEAGRRLGAAKSSSGRDSGWERFDWVSESRNVSRAKESTGEGRAGVRAAKAKSADICATCLSRLGQIRSLASSAISSTIDWPKISSSTFSSTASTIRARTSGANAISSFWVTGMGASIARSKTAWATRGSRATATGELTGMARDWALATSNGSRAALSSA